MTFDHEAARAQCETLHLPWEYYEYDDQIVCQNIETETGEFGVELSRWKEQICQYLGEKRSGEIITAVNLLPSALDEIERLKISAYGWEADACKFARNSDYWRDRCTSADQTIEQNTALIAQLKSDLVAKSVTVDAMCKQLELSATHIAELDAKCVSQKREIRVLQENDCKWFQEALSNRLNFNRNAEDLAKRLNKDKIAKQRAALKKLGKAKRERGKALVEERAKTVKIFWGAGNGPLTGAEIYVLKLIEARSQLRREGIL